MMPDEIIKGLLETSKKEGGLLAAFEACGRFIEELQSELCFKDLEIEKLRKELAEVKKQCS